jgi:hypothetical protein
MLHADSLVFANHFYDRCQIPNVFLQQLSTAPIRSPTSEEKNEVQVTDLHITSIWKLGDVSRIP